MSVKVARWAAPKVRERAQEHGSISEYLWQLILRDLDKKR